MRVNKKNNDIITCSSVLNHLRSKRVCVFYSLLFLALLEVRTYSRKTTSIDWRDSRRVIFSRFLPRAMVASTVFEADSARCFHSNALGRANIATRQVFSNVQKFKDWIQKCWLFSFDWHKPQLFWQLFATFSFLQCPFSANTSQLWGTPRALRSSS